MLLTCWEVMGETGANIFHSSGSSRSILMSLSRRYRILNGGTSSEVDLKPWHMGEMKEPAS